MEDLRRCCCIGFCCTDNAPCILRQMLPCCRVAEGTVVAGRQAGQPAHHLLLPGNHDGPLGPEHFHRAEGLLLRRDAAAGCELGTDLDVPVLCCRKEHDVLRYPGEITQDL